MLFESITNSGSLPALEKLAAFTEARHRVLLTNVANLNTPGYRVRDADVGEFQTALSEALARRERAGAPLEVDEGGSWQFDRDGRLQIKPVQIEPNNVLFHDGTNASVERQMNELAKNAILHQTAVELLRGRYGGLMKAIRGRVS